MSAPRLTFLYPIFYRPIRAIRATPRQLPVPSSPKRFQPRGRFSTSTRRHQGTRPQRYGTAHEPPPHLSGGRIVASHDDIVPKPQETGPDTRPVNEKPPASPSNEVPDKPSGALSFQDATPRPKALDVAEPLALPSTSDPPRVAESKPLETILHMPSPAEEEKKKPPHLQTPPYVHHFDTYGLVKDLETSGFSQDQAITIMKAVRGILTINMELARDGLVSKSNVENESYLFRAACSELRTEISNNRKGEAEKLRTERNQLQHEVDILNQRLAQESLALKDELKGMFNDRKMAVRMEQRSMESKIQELNYKITVALNSDARSEVEGLRWVLTRRAAIAIAISAVMILSTLRYNSYMTKTQEHERKNVSKELQATEAEGTRAANGGSALGTGVSNGLPRSGVGSEDALGGELLASEGGVSLG
ncbi:hypothetical protein AOQ84DRAFT_389685 [Glonium stellatum]|uniref:Uncharacterized protein n=1 Tax=Glonium stellatum TaxID=574774 RepID=A0A8E2JRQ3_9PEZI|nr:hypothetical protein AOQ84DRAFT_389685 [Glonium stellatum]